MTVDRENQAASCSQDPASILKHFAMLPDPRREHGRLHPLDEILFMAVCAVLCGADTWQEIADYAESKRDWRKACRRPIRFAASFACSTRSLFRRVSSTG